MVIATEMTNISHMATGARLNKVAFTIKETAEIASVDKSTVVLAIQEGRLIARAIGGTAIVLRSDIEAWLESLPVYRVMG